MEENELNFNDLFVPLTDKKAIIWLILVAFFIYFLSLFNGFVWDDNVFIVNNPDVHSFNVFKLFTNNRFNSADYYRPIPAVYFALIYSVFHANAFIYHLTQVCLHIIVVCLLYILFKRFFSRVIAFFLSFVFLIHPLNVESVAFIGASQSELFTLFGLLSLFVIFKKRKSHYSYVLFAFLTLLMLLTKEVAILFVLLLIIWKLLYNKKNIFVIISIQVATFLIYLFLRLSVAGVGLKNIGLAPIARLSFSERIMNIPAIVYYYLKMTFLPYRFAIDQQWIITKITLTNFFIPLAIDISFLIILLVLGYYINKKNHQLFKSYVLFLIWFIAGLFFIIQLFPLDMTVADRWFYFPLIGLVGTFGVLGNFFSNVIKKYKVFGIIIMTCYLMFLSTNTIARSFNWKNELILYTHDSQISDNFDIENNLSTVYFTQGDLKSALSHAKRSVKYFPYEVNLNNLGTMYLYNGDLELARETYYRSLHSKPYAAINHLHYSGTYERLAWTQLYSEEFDVAQKTITQGLQDYPHEKLLWYELAICQYKQNNYSAALDAVVKAKNYDNSNDNIMYLYKQITNRKPIELGTSNLTIDVIGP